MHDLPVIKVDIIDGEVQASESHLKSCLRSPYQVAAVALDQVCRTSVKKASTSSRVMSAALTDKSLSAKYSIKNREVR